MSTTRAEVFGKTTQSTGNDFAEAREAMVEMQIARRGISDARVLDAMRRIPREAFVPSELLEFAYDDTPLPIGEGQTISQPYIVAEMTEAAEIGAGDRVLDVGTGSGYAAAILSLMAGEVYTIERHATHADAARERLRRLGHDNVAVRHGDGARGWLGAAPFDAIIVAAMGEAVPKQLCQQLKVGGRLVIPVGAPGAPGRLLRIVRTGETEYQEEDRGAVAFVPLIQDQDAPDPAAPPVEPHRPAGRGEEVWRVSPEGSVRSTVDLIRDAAEMLPAPDDPEFGRSFDRFAKARVVLIGEASHGTSEFYRARAQITRRLIEEHGFSIVAVEADWPDAASIDRYVRHSQSSRRDIRAFDRFPTWMWRNTDVRDFVDWLRDHNSGASAPDRQVSFHGLDLYSLNSSVRAVIDYLDKTDPEAARVARERYGCFTPWQKDPTVYGRAALTAGYNLCEREVVAMLRDLLEGTIEDGRADDEEFFDAAQNARLVAAAEHYYRSMYHGSRDSWNLRDRHMFETLEHILAARGESAKAVVWAHNSHVGDAAATDMGMVRGQLNIGQLCRERFGDDAILIGFGTDRGTVAAASDWGGEMEVKTVRPSHEDSYERLCRDSRESRFLLDLKSSRNEALRDALVQPRLERAIGVIYRPETELMSHYFDASLPRQFDAYVWFEETRAVTPLPAGPPHGAPDTYPFGV